MNSIQICVFKVFGIIWNVVGQHRIAFLFVLDYSWKRVGIYLRDTFEYLEVFEELIKSVN